jgi:tetratricopeptide (TPR) repeat protein
MRIKILVIACSLVIALRCVGQEATPPAQSSVFAATQTLARQGRYDDALSQLEMLAAQKNAPAGLAREFGTAYYQKGDYLKAVEALKKAEIENPGDREATQLLGLSYYLGGHPTEAIPYLEKVQTWFPRSNVDASYILGVCYIQSKNYDGARKAFATMYGVPVDSAAAYLFTARMLLRQEFDPVAEEYAKKTVAVDSRLPLAHFLLGELYLYKSRIPEAIAELQKESALNPGHAATYYKLGDAYSRLIWLDATSTGPYILMGKVLLKKGESELAVRALRHAETMDPSNAMPHQLLGQAYRELGDAAAAERELRLANEAHLEGDAPKIPGAPETK